MLNWKTTQRKSTRCLRRVTRSKTSGRDKPTLCTVITIQLSLGLEEGRGIEIRRFGATSANVSDGWSSNDKQEHRCQREDLQAS